MEYGAKQCRANYDAPTKTTALLASERGQFWLLHTYTYRRQTAHKKVQYVTCTDLGREAN